MKRAVDFDKTLAYSEPGTTSKLGYDPYRTGPPIPKMLKRVLKWLEQGDEVVIFTARVHDKDPKIRQVLEEWSKRYIGQVLEITNEKTPDMDFIYDDKGVTVEINTGEFLGVEQE